jgi:hypothetical protein
VGLAADQLAFLAAATGLDGRDLPDPVPLDG